MHLILGSQSARRKEILSYFSYPFEQVAHSFAEEQIPFKGDPVEYANTLSKAKASSLAPRFPKAVILTADTVVFHAGKIFNKPQTEDEGLDMLKQLQGSYHSVFTAVTAHSEKKEITTCTETRIQFRHLTEEQLKLYHAAFNGMDKAGGYGIQMGGSVIVERIEGCFHNVMGLPIAAVQKVLLEVGIDLWHYLISY